MVRSLGNANDRAADVVSGAIAEGVEALREGRLVVYPTETFYGLGADPFSDRALRRLFDLKGREAGKPVALIASDLTSALSVAREVPAAAHRLAEIFWPGPLTLVMPARAELHSALIGRDGCVGVRVSSHPVARALAAGLGRPITATSANRSGEAAAITLCAARAALGEAVAVYLDGGTLAGGPPSTVAAFDSNAVRVIRAGAISEEAIASVLATGARK